MGSGASRQHFPSFPLQEDEESRAPGSDPPESLQGRGQTAGGSSGGQNSGGERCQAESDVDMSEDEDEVRSRDSVSVTMESKVSVCVGCE